MNPYNINGCGINKWIDLDSVLEIDFPKYGEMRYRLAFTDDYVYVKFSDEHWYNFEYQCYEPFLKAWKNKDIINVEKR
jgi:hypothetical protein